MWAVAATLERGRPVLNDWGMDLHDLGYGRRMVSELFKEEAFEVKFTGPSVSGAWKKIKQYRALDSRSRKTTTFNQFKFSRLFSKNTHPGKRHCTFFHHKS